MINVYLCEDQPQQLTYFSEIIKRELYHHPFEAQWKTSTSNPEKLLQTIQNAEKTTGLYFLDIVLKNPVCNGIQLAYKIRQIDPRGYIVFITSHSEFSYMALKYQVEPLDFILKDLQNEMENNIKKCICTAIKTEQHRLQNDESLIPIKAGKITQYMASNDILYFSTRSSSHRIYIHTLSGEVSFYGSLDELTKEMESYHFLRCHKSILVNQKHIRTFNKKERYIELSNGEHCTISATYVKKLKELLT